ncbi:MAG: hypothetical protein JW776_11225 [Candidatus Lokiarchaeota archaeon]|nr:hypothetical protein [Candidatus Lokiarchaeota archaeon]
MSEYSKLLEGIESIEIAAKHKGLAKLGDEIVNMVYSLGVSLFLTHPTGEKVNASILAESMKRSGLRHLAKSRANAHSIADSAEAIIAYAFLQQKITISELVEKILHGIGKKDYPWQNTQMKREADINALTELLFFIKSLYFAD